MARAPRSWYSISAWARRDSIELAEVPCHMLPTTVRVTRQGFFKSLRLNPRWTAWVRPQRVFVIFAIVFGLSLAALTAPFQAPDEPQHFLRAYQISEGGIFPTYLQDRGGGELPASLTEVSRRFASLRFTYRAKTSPDKIREASRIALKPHIRQFTPFVTAIYSPVAYIPQATTFWIGRQFDMPPLELMLSLIHI